LSKLDLLHNINLGNSVAEYDKYLEEYFVTTPAFLDVISGRYDIVRGTKGSGKSAILLNLLKGKNNINELDDTILIPATDYQGDPIFKNAFANINLPVNEDKLIDSWKIFLINVIWPQIYEVVGNKTDIEKYLISHKLIISPLNLFGKIRFSLSRVLSPKELKGTFKDPTGFEYSGEVVLADPESEPTNGVNFNYIFRTFNDSISKTGKQIWVLMDRLDDAFPDNPQLESIALKSLLYAYKDIAGLSNIKIKIFLRDDIYDRVTGSGFRSLTHVNSNAMPPISWSDEKLLNLLIDRLLFNKNFKEYLITQGYDPKTISTNDDREILLLILFRDQVDVGPKSPKTFRWIINHIRDGNGIATPRDLIALVDSARQKQVEDWTLNGVSAEDNFLIAPSALKHAWGIVSADKLKTQLYAEYSHLKPQISKFKGSKAEHNIDTLKQLLGDGWKDIVEELVFTGFLEQLSSTWKIPFLYREALGISQGKAFNNEEESQ